MAPPEFLDEHMEFLCERQSAADGNAPRGAETRDEINACIDQLRELVGLGTELLDLVDPAGTDAEFSQLRRWLEADIRRQREVLSDLNAQGYSGLVRH